MTEIAAEKRDTQMEKRENTLAVAALERGTVIDHIPVGSLFQCVRLLGLESLESAVTIGNNLPSARMGKKGIIKVSDTVFAPEVINRIAVIAPTAVVNVIEGYGVVSKTRVSLPEKLVGIVKCTNPKCVCNHEEMSTRFTMAEAAPLTLRCDYCEHEYAGDKIVLL